MNRRSILLTGATGNAGRPVLHALLSAGYFVTAVVRKGSLATLEPECHPQMRVITADLRDICKSSPRKSPLRDENPDAIVHLASSRADTPREVKKNDIVPLESLLGGWNKGAFIYASSQVVYGTVQGRTVDENAPMHPEGAYDEGKVASEKLVMEARSGDRTAVCLRIPILWANGPRRNDRQLIAPFLEHARACRPFVMASERDLEECGTEILGENDMASSVIAALAIGPEHSGSYNIGSFFMPWKTMIDQFSRDTGKRPRYVIRQDGRPLRNWEIRLPHSHASLDTRRFRAITGWKPVDTLDTLMAGYLDSQ